MNAVSPGKETPLNRQQTLVEWKCFYHISVCTIIMLNKTLSVLLILL